ALAAGHRPCYECQRSAAKAFAAAWSDPAPRAGEMDDILHPARRAGPWRANAADLPPGAMIAWHGGQALLGDGTLHPWSFEGYGAAAERPTGAVDVVTPAPTVRCLRNGYRPQVDASAGWDATELD
ncbi:MAG: hypothetical protein AAFQ51_15540, partial [Pseudomonadota bacterium]